MKNVCIPVLVLLSLSLTTQSAGALQTSGNLEIETRVLVTDQGDQIRAEFGTLSVPENRANPDSRLITLAFVRLKSDPAPDGVPTIYLAGGPGNGSTSIANNPGQLRIWSRFLAAGDLILFDQRATGESTPQMRMWVRVPIPRDVLTNPLSAERHVAAITRRAVERYRSRGFDFSGYTALESAADINDVRVALGIDSINLFGFSYGTHLALAFLREYEEFVASMVLIGVEGLDETHKFPLNMDTQFGKLAGIVADDPEIGSEVPDMVALLDSAFARLDADPIIVRVTNPATDSVLALPVGRFGLAWLLKFDLGDASDLPVFPRLLQSVVDGDPEMLRWFVQKRMIHFAAVNLMSKLVDGASGASPHRWSMIHEQARRSRFGNVTNFPWPAVDRVTGVRDLGEDYRAPLASDVRALLLTGSLDRNTPPYQAERLRWGMRNAIHVTVENAGHEQILNDQTRDLIIRFLSGESIPRTDIILPPVRFVPIRGCVSSVTHPSLAESVCD